MPPANRVVSTRRRAWRRWISEPRCRGSTLTMQVARLLEDGTTGQMKGKLRQMRVALALERRLSKERILSLYLDRAPFGGNLEGVRAALGDPARAASSP